MIEAFGRCQAGATADRACFAEMAPNSFSHTIYCTTCKGRLVVRSPRAIGQILPCPKCGSMVMVTPPEGGVPTEHDADTPADPASTAAQQSPATQPAQQPSKTAAAPPPAATAAPQDTLKPRPALSPRDRNAAAMQGLAETVDDLEAIAPGVAAQAETTAEAPSLDGAEPAAGPLLPSQAAGAAPPWQRPLVWGGAACGLIVVILVAWGYFALGGDDSPPKVATNPQQSENVAADDALPVTPADDDTSAAHDESEDEAAHTVDPTEASPDDDTASEDSNPDSEPSDNDLPADDDNGTQEPPIEIDETAPAAPGDLEHLFGNFGDFVEPGTGATTPPLESPAEGGDADLERSWPELALRDRPSFTPVDVEARLAYPLSGITLSDAPLRDVLELMSSITTIPVVIDPEALAQAQVSLQASTSLDLSNTTAGAVLEAALSAHGLKLRTLHGSATIEVPSPEDGLRTASYDLTDLTGGDPQQLETLAALIQQFVEPQSWNAEGGPGLLSLDGSSVVIQQSEPAHWQTQVLLEKLRLARGLPLEGSSAERFTLTSRSAQLADKLELPVRLNYPDSMSLKKILARLEEESGLVMLVNWQALGDLGWPADAEATLEVDNAPLEEALYRLLAPMELTWRAVDGRTLQITTAIALEQSPELEVYRLNPAVLSAATPDQIDDEIAVDFGITNFATGGGNGQLHYDAQSHTLFVLLPQPQQRQLERMLRTWRPFGTG